MNEDSNFTSDDTLTSVSQTSTAQSDIDFSSDRTYIVANGNGKTEDKSCGICGKQPGKKIARWVRCDRCNLWFHISCVGVSKKQFTVIRENENVEWTCKVCKKGGSMVNSKVSWGEYTSEEELRIAVDEIYIEIVSWTKN